MVSLALRPQKIKPLKNWKGYLFVRLCVCGKKINKRIHRLVAIHFIFNPFNLPVVHHIDGNKENNCANNLKWVTYKENAIEAWKMGRTVTEETRRKLSLANKGRKLSEEIRVKRIGRKLTEETKRKNINGTQT